MSRAFMKDNDSWDYCTKAGETCFYAERGKECKREDCEYLKFSNPVQSKKKTEKKES
jgi:hypothetical protein